MKSTVYGPVKSWRFGNSLGIDPILKTSVCSFNCIYCQLGYIQNIQIERELFVSTKQIIDDLSQFDLNLIDTITFSGSGEPTLALNFSEIAFEIKKRHPHVNLLILTNSTTLHLPEVMQGLQVFDEVCCKYDAFNTKSLMKINRPEKSIEHQNILKNLIQMKANVKNLFSLQIALLKNHLPDVQLLREQLLLIQADKIYLNRPKRPHPKKWELKYRGDHIKKSDQVHDKGKVLSILSEKELLQWAKPLIDEFRERVIL